MSTLAIGALYGVSTLVVMFSGIPIAFALGIVAVAFMVMFMPVATLDAIAQNVYHEMGNIIILSVPLFILKGAAIGRTDAGRDLYLALHAWFQRVPGGLGVANTVACGLFAATWLKRSPSWARWSRCASTDQPRLARNALSMMA